MVDRRVATAALVALAVLALGATAGTIDSVGAPEPQDRDREIGERRTPPPPEEASTIGCPAMLADPLVLGGILGAALVGGFVAYAARGDAVAPAVVVTPVVLGIALLCPASLPLGLPGVAIPGVGAPVVLGGLGLLVVGGAIALLYVATGGDATVAGADAEPEPATDLTALGEAAGDAADRIDTQADVSNEVYRAWVEMTRHLDVPDPETTTPDEFADAAVDAGMAREDVARLTRLFQDVRYGGADADTRADAAVEALRRIERTYGGDGR